ncbi:MAG: ABC transporter substrate-binding protein [Candidatus Binatia bacterium]
MNKKRIKRGLACLGFLIAFIMHTGFGLALEDLRIPVASPTSLSSLAEQVAIHYGMFKDIGYNGKIYSVSGGESAAVLALEKGKLPFFSTDDNIPLAIRPKSKIKIVAVTINKLSYYLAASSKVKSYKDLPQKGIRVGISSPTSANVYVSLKLLEKNGIKKPRLIKVGGSTGRLAAVKAEKVDVGSLTFGPMLKAKAAGLNILGSASEFVDEFAFIQVGMNEDWVKSNTEKAVAIVGTFIRACDYINRNREGTIAVLTKVMKNKPSIANQMYDIKIAKERVVPRRCSFSEKGIRAYVDAAKFSKAIDPGLKVPPISSFTMPDLHKKGVAWFKKKTGR